MAAGSVKAFFLILRHLAVALIGLAILAKGAAAQTAFESKVDFAILVDVATDTVLYQKRADERMAPASMAKLMTSLIAFEQLKAGKLQLNTPFLISENAWRKGGAPSRGSAMFAAVNSSVQLSDLLRGIIVQSGNDACIAFAEGIAVTEADFAMLMNENAKRIGMKDTHFTNSTGLPDPDQWTTARDLATLAEYIINNFPEYYRIYSEREFTWNKVRQLNRNPLLDMNIGADGMKTGNTSESGYGLVGSVVQSGRRVIVVVNGAKTDKERSEEARKLIDYGFRGFSPTTLFGLGDIVAEARVYGGDAGSVGLRSRTPVTVLLPTNPNEKIRAEVVYRGPLPAPLKQDQEAGSLLVRIGDNVVSRTPLYTDAAVERGGFYDRAIGAARELLFGWW
jgi:D-alanyl-D-alanine carboxypeptidase (penicillin-binding protein 5/6)